MRPYLDFVLLLAWVMGVLLTIASVLLFVASTLYAAMGWRYAGAMFGATVVLSLPMGAMGLFLLSPARRAHAWVAAAVLFVAATFSTWFARATSPHTPIPWPWIAMEFLAGIAVLFVWFAAKSARFGSNV